MVFDNRQGPLCVIALARVPHCSAGAQSAGSQERLS